MRCLALLLFTLMALPVQAAGPSTREKLERVENQIHKGTTQQEELESQVENISEELGSLRKKLIAATSAADRSSANLQELETNLNDLEGAAARRSEQMIEQREELAKTLALVQRLAQTPREVVLFSQSPLIDRLRTDQQLKVLLPEIQRRADELSASVHDLRELRRRLEEQKKKVLSEQKLYQQQAAELERLVQQRDRKLAETRAATVALSSRLDRLSRDAKDLRDLMNRLQREPDEVRQTKAIPLPQGALRRLPLSAPATVKFGETDSFGNTSTGITLRPRANAPVAAVASGRVAFAGPFRGYGRILILKHDGGFHSVVAGLAKVSVGVGDKIAAGEQLGSMPDSSAVPPELYFEIRFNGEPVDPLGPIAARLTQKGAR